MSMWGDRRRRAYRAQTGDLAAAQRVVDQALAAADELAAMHDSALLDLTNRTHGAVELIDELLRFHRNRSRELRPEDLPNALLDVRQLLAPGSQLLPLRPSVPVIPGRAS